VRTGTSAAHLTIRCSYSINAAFVAGSPRQLDDLRMKGRKLPVRARIALNAKTDPDHRTLSMSRREPDDASAGAPKKLRLPFIDSAPLTTSATIGYGFGILSIVACYWIAFATTATVTTSATNDRALNLLFLTVAGATGWLTGILLSPREEQAEQFNQYIHAIGAFVTGFVLAKAGDIVDLLVRKEIQPSDVAIIRMLLFGSMFFITLTWQFASRERFKAYLAQNPELLPERKFKAYLEQHPELLPDAPQATSAGGERPL
jgi:hypothetical protein